MLHAHCSVRREPGSCAIPARVVAAEKARDARSCHGLRGATTFAVARDTYI